MRIAGLKGQRGVLLEGQMRLAFAREGLSAAGVADFNLMLVDCDDATRARRLVANRNQPELANATMMNWAAYLRKEAREAGYEILDTSQTSLEASVARVCLHLMDRRPRDSSDKRRDFGDLYPPSARLAKAISPSVT